jgi:MoxR-like ATPase
MSKIQELRKALKSNFYEREEIVDGMLTALLAEENVFLLGPPGTAKSALCESLCRALSGNYFSWLVGKFTTPEELFGPVSFDSLQTGKYERVTTGKLPEADVAFLDEIFKGSSAILNTLLPILNERKFHNNGEHKVPLKIVFGASNEIPQAEELAALYDRFAVRFVVNRIRAEQNAEELFKRASGQTQPVPIPGVSAEEVLAARKACSEVTMSEDMLKITLKLRHEMSNQGYYVSDRKWVQAIGIIKAFAFLNGHAQIEETDFDILDSVLWTNPDDIKNIRKIIRKIANPMGEDVLRVTDAVYEVLEKLESGTMDAPEGHAKIKKAVEHLSQLTQKAPNNQRIGEALVDTKKALQKVVTKYLGVSLEA